MKVAEPFHIIKFEIRREKFVSASRVNILKEKQIKNFNYYK